MRVPPGLVLRPPTTKKFHRLLAAIRHLGPLTPLLKRTLISPCTFLDSLHRPKILRAQGLSCQSRYRKRPHPRLRNPFSSTEFRRLQRHDLHRVVAVGDGVLQGEQQLGFSVLVAEWQLPHAAH